MQIDSAHFHPNPLFNKHRILSFLPLSSHLTSHMYESTVFGGVEQKTFSIS